MIGPVLDSVRLGEGLLVGTARLGKNRIVNLQVNKEDVPETESLSYAQTLTIGTFSKVWGSGFSKPENIYYRKRIWYEGRDVFEIEGDRYLVEWWCDYKNPLTYVIADMYTITFSALGERTR